VQPVAGDDRGAATRLTLGQGAPVQGISRALSLLGGRATARRAVRGAGVGVGLLLRLGLGTFLGAHGDDLINRLLYNVFFAELFVDNFFIDHAHPVDAFLLSVLALGHDLALPLI